MTIPLPHTSLALALLAFTTACHSASPSTDTTQTAVAPPPVSMPAAATDTEKELAPRQYAQTRHMESLAERCNWLAPAEMAAVTATAEERHAWLVWQGLDIADAQAQADALVAKTAEMECEGSDAPDWRDGVRYGAWQMRSSWSLRGQAMLPGEDHPTWFSGKTTLENYAPALDEAVAGLLEIDPDSIRNGQTMFQQKAEQMLAVRCEPNDRGCPASVIDAGFRSYAETVIKQTENYAKALSQTEDKTGRPLESPTL